MWVLSAAPLAIYSIGYSLKHMHITPTILIEKCPGKNDIAGCQLRTQKMINHVWLSQNPSIKITVTMVTPVTTKLAGMTLLACHTFGHFGLLVVVHFDFEARNLPEIASNMSKQAARPKMYEWILIALIYIQVIFSSRSPYFPIIFKILRAHQIFAHIFHYRCRIDQTTSGWKDCYATVNGLG